MKSKYRILTFVAVIVITASLHFFRLKDEFTKSSFEDPMPKEEPRKGLFILTNSRSGSSFLGELFNQHPDAFYLYEPLVSVPLDNDTLVLQKLKSIASCQFQNTTVSVLPGDKTSSVLKDCAKHNVCFRERSKVLCSPEYCGDDRQCRNCRKLTSAEISSKCLTKKIAATKVIRLQDFRRIALLLKHESLNVKILHLVRDPRGVMASRQKVKTNVHMRETCREIYRNAKLGLIDSPDWMDGKYKLVRYEDIAISPLEMAKNIYDFVGLHLDDSVREWIRISTQGEVLQSDDLRIAKSIMDKHGNDMPVDKERLEKLVLSDAYSTVRKSNGIWQAWRKSLINSDIDEVQQDCKEMMDLLGYKAIPSIGDEVLAPLRSFSGRTLMRKEDPGCRK